MDDKTKALWDAAFHAWIALGELLVVDDRLDIDQRAELADCHAALQAALEALKAERGRDLAPPPGSA